MSGVFQNIDPPPPSPPGECIPGVHPPPLVRGEDTLAGWREGWGVNILEDARYSSVLYICKYFLFYIVYSESVKIHEAPQCKQYRGDA
jgi:hypothetical protein